MESNKKDFRRLRQSREPTKMFPGGRHVDINRVLLSVVASHVDG